MVPCSLELLMPNLTSAHVFNVASEVGCVRFGLDLFIYETC